MRTIIDEHVIWWYKTIICANFSIQMKPKNSKRLVRLCECLQTFSFQIQCCSHSCQKHVVTMAYFLLSFYVYNSWSTMWLQCIIRWSKLVWAILSSVASIHAMIQWNEWNGNAYNTGDILLMGFSSMQLQLEVMWYGGIQSKWTNIEI